jgi:hypothetical protein
LTLVLQLAGALFEQLKHPPVYRVDHFNQVFVVTNQASQALYGVDSSCMWLFQLLRYVLLFNPDGINDNC